MKGFNRRGLLAASAASMTMPGLARAEDFPTRRVTLIVPFPAGGPVDITAREIGQKLSTAWSQPVIVENRPGADAVIGAQAVATAAPDGYTILVCAIHHSVHPSVKAKLPYDLLKDFRPISGGATFPIIVVANKDAPFSNVRELIAYARANPGKLSYGSAGVGGGTHLAGEMFKSLAGVDLLHVAHRGSAPAMTSVLGNHVQLMFADGPTAIPQIEAKTVKAIAVGSPKRSELVPDIPTMIEEGLPGYECYSWAGLVVPAATPTPIVTKINAGVVAALRDPEVKARLAKVAAEAAPSTPDEFGTFLKSEIAKWAKVAKDAKMTPE
jgi:tripartite-type tricarboxylate transporter receptor subunit TctC